MSLTIARSISPRPNILVVELAALFHDLIDSKYLTEAQKAENITAAAFLGPFFKPHLETGALSEAEAELIAKVVDDVSYSKETKRIQNGKQTEWHLTCGELHCVQDSDKLDAIGGFGILRCAAYSGASNRSLFIPPADSHGPGLIKLDTTGEGSSSVDHFYDKLFKLKGTMKTDIGLVMAQKRHDTMARFVEEIEREWNEIVGKV